ncbi:hypothetical protein CLHOM_24320 [Clostridium homopropionicum DSM 5847]|uniref:Transposase IS200 like protein n=1 Tax=Clostridium homopropionicum DSM 5847 TaxID=1121318 RepID=A0A0L6Z8N0_9CLOT|nr:hypothetical protein [Clostridium homopropionicum]KOA19326.1 hypothetical protein CLHOM_24320 [Clostridium homopropionicum DSM 5847]SFG21241.1 hypothetical protein SAMN04488501_106192 [Clostridium homopropionicum]
MDSTSLSHTKWNCKYHIVFIYGKGNWYDIPLDDFIENVWFELKEEMKIQKEIK